MLWLAVVLPALPLAAFAAPPSPFAVADGRVLVACDAAARRQGLTPGLPVVQAHILCPALCVRPRDLPAEAGVLDMLAAAALRLSPVVTLRRDGVLVQLTDRVTPHGDAATLCARMQRALRPLGLTGQLACAPTAEAAWLCATAATGLVLTRQDRWRERLAALPAAHLPVAPAIQAILAELKIETIGACLALPRAGLRRRFGNGFCDLLERLLGERPEVIVRWQPPAFFSRRLVLSDPIATDTALIFAVQRILRELAVVLRNRAASVRRFRLTLTGEDRRTVDEEFTLMVPARHPRGFAGLIRERWRDRVLPMAVTSVGLDCALAAGEEGSLPLWPSAAVHRRDFAALLDRFQARLGPDAVRALGWRADHRPECAAIESPWPPPPVPARAPVSDVRPLWLVDPPRRLAVVAAQPQWRGPLVLAEGPERIESGWWDGGVARAYFIACNPRQERLWIFRSGEHGWFLQGYFA
ncbi:MAG: Y-family DNA polymerase [Acidiferrobacter sp.]